MSFSPFLPSTDTSRQRLECAGVPSSQPALSHLTPTHIFVDDAQLRVSAWQYQRSAAIPVWIARKFHRLSDESALTSIAADGSLTVCLEGDWIVAFDNFPCGYAAVVLSPSEFTRCFLAL